VAKYLVLYRSTMTAEEQMSQNNPEQAQAGMDAWMAWAQQAGTPSSTLVPHLAWSRPAETPVTRWGGIRFSRPTRPKR
jgi:hypothetical protein